MNYSAFGELVQTMDRAGYDYKKEMAGFKKIDPAQLTLQDHVRAMIYAQLSNNRPWQRIQENIDNGKIPAIFCNFDIAQLKSADPALLVQGLQAIRCGNRQIRKQMNALKDNIAVLERIDRDHGSIHNYYSTKKAQDLVKELSLFYSKNKLKCMGVPLVCEYLKGVGIGVVKPDVHLRRIIGRLGYSRNKPADEWETIAICDKIAAEYHRPHYEVDSILWQYCADGKFAVCGATPNCKKCGVSNCPNRCNRTTSP